MVSPRTAFWISDILADGEAREYVFGRGGHLEFPFSVAVKTGTSQAYHDNWTVGFSRRVTVGVWVGNFDRTPLRNSSGVTGAAPIFHAVMLAAERRLAGGVDPHTQPLVRRPPDVRRGDICALSGGAANAWCPVRQLEWLPSEAHPQPCSWHRQTGDGVLTIWPPEFREWAADDARGRAKAAFGRDAGPAFTISNPPAGATYLIDPTLRREFQTLALKVVAAEEGEVEWLIDDVPAGSTRSDSALMWPLKPGRHRIVAKDRAGRHAATEIVVR